MRPLERARSHVATSRITLCYEVTSADSGGSDGRWVMLGLDKRTSQGDVHGGCEENEERVDSDPGK